MLRFNCVHCRKRLKVPPEAAGRFVDCPQCRQRIQVPTALDPFATSSDTPVDLRGIDLSLILAPAKTDGELGSLGGCRVLGALSKGGMGIVFRAVDESLGRTVALKTIRPDKSTPLDRERFLREARLAAKVEHDHIVTIYRVGEERGVPYIVMPLLRGRSLEARLKGEGPLSAPEVLRIGAQAAEGLQAAHDQGIIHRDIKPANLFLEGERGKVKILDFGVARTGEASDVKLTQTGTQPGTLVYMSPEQVRGRKELDGRSDLFSLGGTLYHALTGRPPFTAESGYELMGEIVSKQPLTLASLCREAPAELCELVTRLLAKLPEDRPASAAEVAAALRRVMSQLSQGPTDREYTNGLGMRFARIPAATFLMGATKDVDPEAYGDEGPRHEVRITRDFYLGVYTVTQRQWREVMGDNPSWFRQGGGGEAEVRGLDTDDFPVESVSYEDVEKFLSRLSEREKNRRGGWIYSLPTEAEWEYSCPGVPAFKKYHFGDTLSPDQANYRDTKLGRTAKVGSYPANAFGLHDMHGNVWEWCADWFGPYPAGPVADPSGPSQGSGRVRRGGSWDDSSRFCRSAIRDRLAPEFRYGYLGFRVALVPSGKSSRERNGA